MKRFNQAMTGLYAQITTGWSEFKKSEQGDTNFISILIILAIVVVLAGLFLTLGTTVMTSVTDRVTGFINGLGD